MPRAQGQELGAEHPARKGRPQAAARPSDPGPTVPIPNKDQEEDRRALSTRWTYRPTGEDAGTGSVLGPGLGSGVRPSLQVSGLQTEDKDRWSGRPCARGTWASAKDNRLAEGEDVGTFWIWEGAVCAAPGLGLRMMTAVAVLEQPGR